MVRCRPPKCAPPIGSTVTCRSSRSIHRIPWISTRRTTPNDAAAIQPLRDRRRRRVRRARERTRPRVVRPGRDAIPARRTRAAAPEPARRGSRASCPTRNVRRCCGRSTSTGPARRPRPASSARRSAVVPARVPSVQVDITAAPPAGTRPPAARSASFDATRSCTRWHRTRPPHAGTSSPTARASSTSGTRHAPVDVERADRCLRDRSRPHHGRLRRRHPRHAAVLPAAAHQSPTPASPARWTSVRWPTRASSEKSSTASTAHVRRRRVLSASRARAARCRATRLDAVTLPTRRAVPIDAASCHRTRT